jgi:hypothetical protein
MFARMARAILVLIPAVPVLHAAPVPPRDGPSPGDVKKAEQRVRDRLNELKGAGALVEYVADESLRRAVPGHLFFSAVFRQYPILRVPPAPLKAQNLFAVDPDGKLELLTGVKALEGYLGKHWRDVKDEKQVGDAGLAWLRLVEVFHQDGFYKFKTVTSATRVQAEGVGGGGVKVTAQAVVMAGGNGEINVALTFNGGKLVKAVEDGKLRPGPRPICQATKLLDPDPLVRRICEQDLLIMGRAAQDYLDEQRARAGPELRQAIDRVWRRILDQDP